MGENCTVSGVNGGFCELAFSHILPTMRSIEGEAEVGTTYVGVTIRNPAEPDRTWTGTFVADTGAFDSLVPGSLLEAIGLAPRGSREYILADGSRGGTVIYGDEGAQPLLGVTALESGGFQVDPGDERLKRLPAIPL